MRTSEAHRLYYAQQFPDANSHPQRQGLSQEEYTGALERDSTVNASVRVSGRTVLVPQLFEVDVSAWNNVDFYKTHANDAPVAQLNLTSGVPLADDTERAIQKLACNNGTVAFDIPSNDQDGLDRIVFDLRNRGIHLADPELVGTQTYFAGNIRLLAPKKDREKKTIGLTATFQETVELCLQQTIGDDTKDTSDAFVEHFGKRSKVHMHNGTWLYENVPLEMAGQLYGFYEEAYYDLADSPLRQGLSPEEFHKMTTDDTKASKLVYSKEGKPETVFIVTPNIRGLDWVNANWYEDKYPEETADESLVWFPGIATDRNAPTYFNGQRIITLLARLGNIGNFEPTIVFDFCDHNVEVGLHRAIEYWVKKTKIAEIEFEEIANQKYYTAKLS